MSKQRRLGKGIDALLQGRDLEQLEAAGERIRNVAVDHIAPNPEQPRKEFDQAALQELADSINERGVLQPILVQETEPDRFMIIAGERRYRAAKLAGLTVVPVIVGQFSADEVLEIALVENIQRADLNPIEEANAYAELAQRRGWTQDQLAKHLGKSRPAIANALRLLKLPQATRNAVATGSLSPGHARAFLGLTEPGLIEALAKRTTDNQVSVRTVERWVQQLNAGSPLEQLDTEHLTDAPVQAPDTAPSPAKPSSRPSGDGSDAAPQLSIELQQIQQQLIEHLGTRVRVRGDHTKGTIEIAYLSMDDLDRVIEIINRTS